MEIKSKYCPAFKEFTVVKPDRLQHTGGASRQVENSVLEHREDDWAGSPRMNRSFLDEGQVCTNRQAY